MLCKEVTVESDGTRVIVLRHINCYTPTIAHYTFLLPSRSPTFLISQSQDVFKWLTIHLHRRKMLNGYIFFHLAPISYSFNHRTRLVDPIEETREITSRYEQRFDIFRSIACALSVSFDSIGRHSTSTLASPEAAQAFAPSSSCVTSLSRTSFCSNFNKKEDAYSRQIGPRDLGA